MKRNLSTLLFSIGLMLSGNVFAADSTPHRVTQAEFNAAIANQATINTALKNDIAKLQEAIEKLTVKKIGDHFGGGIIFYVDTTGQHGLIASLSDHLSDQSFFIQWFNGINKVTGATGDGVGAGATNTAIIVAAQSNDTPGGNFAAKVAADFSVQEDGLTACTDSVDEICHGDWYLPSKHELNLLYQQRGVVGGFTDSFYWSSTEGDAAHAWYQVFGDTTQGNGVKYNPLRVRAVRAF